MLKKAAKSEEPPNRDQAIFGEKETVTKTALSRLCDMGSTLPLGGKRAKKRKRRKIAQFSFRFDKSRS